MPELRNAYALVVGIANYQHVNSLPQVVLKDAQDIANYSWMQMSAAIRPITFDYC